MSLLTVNQINKTYTSGSLRVKALDNLSLTVSPGEFIAIMGPSGSGKTTLLNCLSTIDQPDSGSIYLNATDIYKLKGKKLNKFRNKELGFIFQDFNLLDTLTNYENIALTLTLINTTPKEIETKVNHTAKILGIENLLEKYPYQCSGGQKLRIACARAIINNPSLILADEPTGALDSENRTRLMECFTDLNQNHHATLLMVTHDATSASYANKVFFIKDGKLANTLENNGNREQFYHAISTQFEQLGGH